MRFGGGGLVTDAANHWAGSVCGQHLRGVGRIEPCVRHKDRGQSFSGREPLQPPGLSVRRGAVPFRLDMHGVDDPAARSVAPVVRGQVVPPQRRIITVSKRDRLFILKPGIAIGAQIPEMLVRIDHIDM